MKPCRILIIDEQVLFRNLLAHYLSNSLGCEIVGEAGGSCKGRALCQQLKPDLVIWDMHTPRIDGIELSELLREKNPDLHILAVTDLADRFTISRVLNLQLSGFVEKSQSLEILFQALPAIRSGRKFYTSLFHKTIQEFQEDPNAFPKILSDREQEVLGHVAEGITSADIGNRMGLSRRTVETHRYNIIKKMGLHDLAGLMKFAVVQGFKNEDCASREFKTCNC